MSVLPVWTVRPDPRRRGWLLNFGGPESKIFPAKHLALHAAGEMFRSLGEAPMRVRIYTKAGRLQESRTFPRAR